MDAIKRIGIIGGGQLGMMLLEAAKRMNSTVHHVVLESQEDCPARPFADEFILGSLKNPEAITALASVSDVITWEIEHIDVDTLLRLEAQGQRIIPLPRVLQMIQDKGLQKEYFTQKDIPTAPYILVDAGEPIDLERFSGDMVVLKSRKGGYDGKGVALVKKDDIRKGVMPFEGPILVEQCVENVKELAIIVAVDIHGNVVCSPSIDMYFNAQSNLVEFLYSPSLLSGEVLERATHIAQTVVTSFHSAGLFAVEMFLTETGDIWVNEIAPRPHNSGHHSIEGFETSQFEQLYRILCGQAVGSFGLKQASAMINIVGPSTFSGGYQLAEQEYWSEQQDVFVHLYGKTETRPDRKLGHVTVIAEEVNGLLLRAKEVQDRIKIIPS